MLRNPRLCGYRSRKATVERGSGSIAYRYEIVKLADGSEVKGQWTAIVSRADWDDLIAKIGTHANEDAFYQGAGVARYLLSGMVFCGRCGAKMNGSYQTKGAKNYYHYMCPTGRPGACANNVRSMPMVDALVEELALGLHATDGGEHLEAAADTASHVAELERIEGLLSDAYKAWKDSQLPSGDYFTIRRDLDSERDRIVKEQASVARAAASTDVEEIVRRWPDATVQERRLFVKCYVAAVVIHPIVDVWDPTRQRLVHPKGFNPQLIEPVKVRQRRPTPGGG
jgi:hypothetical protein